MSRDPYRSSTGELGRGGGGGGGGGSGERWDRERFLFERDRDKYGDERVVRSFEEDDHVYDRGGSRPPPLRPRERSPVHFERRAPPNSRAYDDDYVVRERRSYYDDDEPRYARPPPSATEFDRKIVIDKEKIRESSPPRRPGMLLRRQSSLDTFDRRPSRFYEQREEYPPPARREDFRAPPNVPIPLPRTRGLPPPRRYAERSREFYEDIKVSDPDYYGDEEFRPYPERIREKEVIRTRRRSRSRESHGHGRSHRGSTISSHSRSSSTSSSSTTTTETTVKSVRSEYPKKGKTRIPVRLVSERALIDLGYPFIKEGNTIIVQLALGQENIDDLLKLSEDYKRNQVEISGPPPMHSGEVFEERRREEIYMSPADSRSPRMAALPPPPPGGVEVVDRTTVIRDVSPARSVSASTVTTATSRTPYIVDARPFEVSEQIPVGPLALVTADHHHRRHRSHSRSHSRGGERLVIRDVDRVRDREYVKAERLSSGELVLYEEKVEKVEEPRRGVRIEKDKKGRMSISVPKYR